MRLLWGLLTGCIATIALAGQQSPWDNVLVPQLLSQEAAIWFESAELPKAGVPCLCRGPSGEIVQLFNYFPAGDSSIDYIARRVSYDDGRTWSAVEPLIWSNGPDPDDISTQADPSLVLLDDGTWRLYFTCHVGKDPFPATWSAVSSDGLHFVWESGKRMELTDSGLLDPSIIRFNGLYHFFAPRPGQPDGAIHATSMNGVDFTRQTDVVVKGHLDTKFLGNPMIRDGQLYFFGTLEPGTSWAGVFSARSDDAVNWTMHWSLAGEIADPAAIETASGVLVFLTSLQGPGG